VASHEAVKRISRPEQRPQRQQRPVAPTEAPTAPDTWSPATQQGVTRSTHSAATAPSAASPAPPAALLTAQTQQRPAPYSATHVAIRCPQSGHLALHSAQRAPSTAPNERPPQRPTSAHRASSVPTAANSSALSGIRAQRKVLRAATTERHQAGQQQCQPSAHHTDQRCRATGSAYPRVHQERPTISAAAHQPRSPSAIRSASLSSAHRAASAPSVAFSAHQ